MSDECPHITDLATTTALTTAENEIHTVSDLIKKQVMMQKYQKW